MQRIAPHVISQQETGVYFSDLTGPHDEFAYVDQTCGVIRCAITPYRLGIATNAAGSPPKSAGTMLLSALTAPNIRTLKMGVFMQLPWIKGWVQFKLMWKWRK